MDVSVDPQIVQELIEYCQSLDRSKFPAASAANLEEMAGMTGGDKNAALYLHFAAAAFRDSNLLRILTGGAVVNAPTPEVLFADLVEPVQDRFPAYFSDCPPQSREFLVLWASQLVMTCDRLVLYSDAQPPQMIRSMRLGVIERFES